MIDGKLFAMFFNASPRKGWNTHRMLEAARAGAEAAGAATASVNLYDVAFPGCKSCFACKLKDAKTNGVCALRDDLRPVLERRGRRMSSCSARPSISAIRRAFTALSWNASRSLCIHTITRTASRLSAATR